jgi:hypothetical protein
MPRPTQLPPGWPVLTFDVTARFLAAGIPGDPCKCPVVLALKYALIWTPLLGRLIDIGDMGADWLISRRPYRTVTTRIPLEVAQYIIAVDSRGRVKPTTLAIDLTEVAWAVERAREAATAAPTT